MSGLQFDVRCVEKRAERAGGVAFERGRERHVGEIGCDLSLPTVGSRSPIAVSQRRELRELVSLLHLLLVVIQAALGLFSLHSAVEPAHTLLPLHQTLCSHTCMSRYTLAT